MSSSHLAFTNVPELDAKIVEERKKLYSTMPLSELIEELLAIKEQIKQDYVSRQPNFRACLHIVKEEIDKRSIPPGQRPSWSLDNPSSD